MNTSSNKGDQRAQIDKLLTDGIAAAKAGEKLRARANFQQVVGLDQYNEKGWMLLATVVDSVDERKVALGNVVVINPENKAAQRMLDEIENPKSRKVPPLRTPEEMEVIVPPNPQRRMLILVGGGAILLVIIMAIAVLALNASSGPPPIPTLNSVQAANDNRATNDSLTGTADAGSAAVALAASQTAATTAPTSASDRSTATFGPGVQVVTLPASWTPQPTNTIRGPWTSTALPPPPDGLTGHLVIASSTFPTLNQSLNLAMIDPSGSGRKPLAAGDVGDFGIITPNGQKLIFARYIAGTDAQQIRVENVAGSQPQELASLWNSQPALADQQMPAISENGAALAFVAISIPDNDSTPDIYYVPVHYSPANLFTATPTITMTPTETETATATTKPKGTLTATAEGPTATPTELPAGTATLTATSAYATVRRVTAKDSGVNLWPTISPDGQTVVYSNSKDLSSLNSAVLYSIGIDGKGEKPLTEDMPDALAAAPEFSPDGTQIAFELQASGMTNSEIYIMNADGSNKRKLVTGGDNIRPHWSPDGKNVAFSSNRTGKYEVFIADAQSGAIYQVTQTTVPTICTSWNG